MATNSVLKNQMLLGPLQAQGAVNSKAKASKKNMVFSLNLTALIDAFAILVIFLLSNYNSGAENVQLGKNSHLPFATQSELMSMGTVVQIDNGKYIIDDKVISTEKLVQKLIDLKTLKKDLEGDAKDSLIIQADREMDFLKISDLIRAGGSAGYSHYKFAVLPNSKRN